MRALQRAFTRLCNFAMRRRNDERLAEEIASHIESLTEQNIRAGMSAADARRNANLKFGSVVAVRETYHRERSFLFLENLYADIRYAFRVLRTSPAFTAVTLITLMLGIGTNIVAFGVLNAILLHPLEVRDPQNLYQIRHKAWAIGRLLTTSYPAFEDLRRRNTTFSGMVAINAYSHANMRWRNAVLSASGDEVTGNYFDLLGIQPALGRLFHEADEHGANSVPYLVLSNTLWRSAFHADQTVVGTIVEFNKHPFVVVGVAPGTFHGTERFSWPDYWVPMANERQVQGSDYLRSRASVAVTVIGRLKPGVSARQATDDLNAISAELAKEYPATDDGEPLRLIHPGLIGDEGDVIRGFLWSVNALALLVLAAACANLATLFAARAADRSRELALRVALGSSRQRLVRQMLTEAIMVSLAGGAAGLAGSAFLIRALNRWHPSVDHLDIAVDARVYAVALVLTLASAAVFGMLPAWHASRSSPLQGLKGGLAETTHLGRFTLRDLLLGVQIAICTLLVTSSLVAIRGLVQTLHIPLGFEPHGAMLADVDMGQIPPEGQTSTEKEREIIDAARSIPGVTAVGAVNRTPFTGGLHGVPVFRPGTTDFKLQNSVLAPYVFEISPGYLQAAGTHLLGGRDVLWQDAANTPHVALVNQTFARKLWGETRAFGQHFVLRGRLTEVVGVVEDGKYHDLMESPQPVVYVPRSQSDSNDVVFVVRAQRAPNEMAAALEHTLINLDPDASIHVQSWSDAAASELFPAEAATVVLGGMGILAAMLAITGIFGMAAHTVSRRMKELGIRVALGARKTQVMSAALGRSIMLLVLGSIIGLVAGIFSNRLLSRIVYHANPRDPLVIGGAVLTMALLGLAASAIPACRALAVDPSKLMREDS